MPRSLPWLATTGLVVATILLFAPLPEIASTVLGLAVLDALHLPFFFLLTLGVHQVARGFNPSWPVPRTTLGVLAFAALTELAQAKFGRTFSLTDLLNNALGVAIATLLLARPSPRSRRAILVLTITAVTGLTIALVPVADTALATIYRHRQVPVLGDFEHRYDLKFWFAQGEAPGRRTTVRRSSSSPVEGAFSLEVNAVDAAWAGIHHLPAAFDVSPDMALRFTLTNPGNPLTLGIRIDLQTNGEVTHANHAVTVPQGTKTISIPLNTNQLQPPSSAFDSASPIRLHRLVIHAGETPSPHRYFIDGVHLLKLPE